MIISHALFGAAAGQILLTEALLNTQMSALRDCQQWTGPDADEFFAEWDADVRHRLRSAALKLESLALSPLP